MKVSIIIPTFKPKDYLYECLDSLYNQTFSKKDYEVILILNGPSEPYERSILKYIDKNDELQIRYLYTEKTGVSNARNLGLDVAKGDFIGFIDDDDFVSTTYIEELYYKADHHTISLSYPYAFKDNAQSTQLKYEITDDYDRFASEKDVQYYQPRKYFSGPCMKLIPKNIIGERRFDTRFRNGEDSLFMFLISSGMSKVRFTSKKAIYYRRFREDSASEKKKNITEYLLNRSKLIAAYTHIYFHNIRKYNFKFYATRVAGSIRTVLVHLI